MNFTCILIWTKQSWDVNINIYWPDVWWYKGNARILGMIMAVWLLFKSPYLYKGLWWNVYGYAWDFIQKQLCDIINLTKL